MTMMMTLVADGGAAAAPAGGGGMGSLMGFLPFILVFAIFYFMLIRPSQRRDKERRKQIEEMKAGMRVVFGGGIIGTIKEIKEGTFMVEIANGVVVEIARGAVNRVLAEGEKATVDEKN